MALCLPCAGPIKVPDGEVLGWLWIRGESARLPSETLWVVVHTNTWWAKSSAHRGMVRQPVPHTVHKQQIAVTHQPHRLSYFPFPPPPLHPLRPFPLPHPLPPPPLPPSPRLSHRSRCRLPARYCPDLASCIARWRSSPVSTTPCLPHNDGACRATRSQQLMQERDARTWLPGQQTRPHDVAPSLTCNIIERSCCMHWAAQLHARLVRPRIDLS